MQEPTCFCTPALPKKGRLHAQGAMLTFPQTHSLQLALRPPDPAVLPGSWCNSGYKITYNQAPTGSSGHQTDS